MNIEIRRITEQELPKVAALAGQLLRQHHTTDPLRFFLPENPEQGYEWWFARELRNPNVVLLAAVIETEVGAVEVVGYVYGRLEERDWNLLLDEHAAIHDLFVAPTARQSGVGGRLLETAISELAQLGAVRFVLSTMVSNAAAQKLFAKHGFRPTLLEMTRG
ncbi:MAG TPA: GNAT family N-acetyltransferase [Polyangiaceae bacterium]|nr:GNAT family N-acetyltransferase [Polyangiaceae bacterium]